MRTAADVVDWLKGQGYTDVEAKDDGHDSVEDSLVWWLATTHADAYNSDWDRRDWTLYIKEGHAPLTLKDIDIEIEARHEDVETEHAGNSKDLDPEHEVLDGEIMAELTEHFGLAERANCTGCGMFKPHVAERHSYGVYAGKLCLLCCRKFRDNCGVGQPQGDPHDLDEPVEPE